MMIRAGRMSVGTRLAVGTINISRYNLTHSLQWHKGVDNTDGYNGA